MLKNIGKEEEWKGNKGDKGLKDYKEGKGFKDIKGFKEIKDFNGAMNEWTWQEEGRSR